MCTKNFHAILKEIDIKNNISKTHFIKNCIFLAELSMRNIELPALRCDPYAPENIGVADHNGHIPIPGDMNKPILFFKQGKQYPVS